MSKAKREVWVVCNGQNGCRLNGRHGHLVPAPSPRKRRKKR